MSKGHFTELKQNNLKICMETQKTPVAKAILRKKRELEEIRFLTSDYTELRSTKQHGYCHKNRSMGQDKSPETSQAHNQLIYNTGGKDYVMGKTVSSIHSAGKLDSYIK